MPDGDGLGLNGETGDRALPSFGEHMIQQDCVHPSKHQIGIRVHVILVRNGVNPMLALGAQENLVRDGAV